MKANISIDEDLDKISNGIKILVAERNQFRQQRDDLMKVLETFEEHARLCHDDLGKRSVYSLRLQAAAALQKVKEVKHGR